MTNVLELPPGVRLPEPVQPLDAPPKDADANVRSSMLPIPTGWRLLCVVPEANDRFEGSSLIKSDVTKRNEEIGTTVLFVLKAGPDAYTDKEKFPHGPWCKEGDFVLVRTYAGTRFKIYGKEFRLVADDQIEAVVLDPRGVTRVAA